MTDRRIHGRATIVLAALGLIFAACTAAPAAQPVPLRLQVSLTAAELATFQDALAEVDDAHPGWTVTLEAVPQGSEIERVTTQLAANDLPDVLRLQGLGVQQWIRREAFSELAGRMQSAGLDEADFYDGPMAQFRWDGGLYGIPDTATPEVVYWNRDAFEAASVEPPTADWTYEDMRTAALRLTVDSAGRHPGEAGFDPTDVEMWGWNGGVTYFWQNAFIQALGGNMCANPDCTVMSLTDPATVAAFEWWVTLVRDNHAALYDPYGGSQTGAPGDPFLAGRAAMGSNGAFAIGQLNEAGTIDYDIVPPLVGVDGQRYTPLSTNGYVMSAATEHPNAAWELIQALIETDFLSQTWGAPGHGVPARRSAADSVIDASHAPANQAAILTAMESGEVFRPNTASAFAAYGATLDLFTRMNTGAMPVEDALAAIEAAANEALAPDR